LSCNERTEMKISRDKKLVYILNYVSADDTQHFVHVLNLLRKMKELGWSIVLISEKGGTGTQNVLGHEVRYMSRSGHLTRVLRLMLTLVLLRKQGYRLVFVRISRPAALISAIFGRMLGFTSLFWLSGMVLDFEKKKNTLHKILDGITLKTIVRSTSRFVTGPETMVEYYRSAFCLSDNKIIMLYNDIDIEKFIPAPLQDKSHKPIDILLLHRLSPVRETNKYLPDIVKRLGDIAKSRQEGIVLNIVGDGPERTELESVMDVSVPDLKIKLHGSTPNRKAKAFYSRADIFIMPSYREGFPRVTIEAMAMGLPVVSTDAGGTRDLFGPLQQKYVVSRDDPEAFADRLAELVADPEMCQKLSKENLSFVQRFSTDNVAKMYDEKLSALLD